MPLPIQKLRDGTGSKALATSLTPATAGFSNPNSVGPTQLPFKGIPPGGSSTRTQAGFGSNPSLQTAHSQQERWPTDGFTSMENLFRKQKRFTVILRKNGILGRDNNGKTPIQAAGAQCPPPCVMRKRKKSVPLIVISQRDIRPRNSLVGQRNLANVREGVDQTRTEF